LIGHSHGGSAIWHALASSSLQRKRLNCLRSWSTVGTPFMNFRAEVPSVWRWVCFALLALVMVWLVFVRMDPSETWPAIEKVWAQAMAGQSDWSDLAFVGFFFISLALLTLWSFLRVAAPLLRFLGTSSIAFVTDNNAKLYYGNKWLALWHPLDEPINGLSGTLGNAPEIAPRVRADGWLNLIPFFGPFANRILANAADEFAWAQVTDRLQGADYLQYRLASVGRAPYALRPGFESIHQSIATDMERGADQKAAGTVARIRALLETAYDNQNSQAVFDRLRGVISFQEVIHTSYFAHPEIPSILACHVLRSLSPLVNFDKVPEAVKDARVPPAIKRDLAAPHPRPARRRNLEFVTTMAFWLAPATLLALGASGAYESKIAPETSKYTVRKILSPR
jgi:hypothetical protein